MLRVMTYNMYSGRKPGLDGEKTVYDLEGKIKVMAEQSPDILGLNEVHRGTALSGGRSQADDIADSLGMKYRFFARTIYHNGGEYGIALLSRYPFVSAKVVPIPDCGTDSARFEPRVLIKAVVKAPQGEVTVIISHYGLSEEERISAVNTTLSLLDGTKTVFMGDLNTTPDEKLLMPVFEALHDLGEGTDENELLSHPSWKPAIRIDYIFASKDIKPVSYKVIDTCESDHRPVIAEIEI